MSKLAPAAAERAAPAPAPPAAYGAAAMVDMEDQINHPQSEVLNATSEVGRLLKAGVRDQADLLVESDADEQLLLTIAFKSRVKLHSLQIDAPAGGRAPKAIKLFTNRSSIDFSDAESLPAEQTLDLDEDSLGTRVELRFVKFQAVDRLTIFFESNAGDEESTALSSVRLWGAPVAGMAMGEFKRVAGEKGEGE